MASTAIVTGASRGLGLALARALAARDWRMVIDARDLPGVPAGLEGEVIAIEGDVTDAAHRRALVEAAGDRVDLLVNNASALGPSPLPGLDEYPLAALAHVHHVNVFAPLALVQLVLPLMPPGGRIVNVTSDAAVEPYEGWGGYGSSKASLEQLTRVLAAEHPELGVYAVDPGDMRTRMYQEAFPGEDISDRPEPASVVPAFVRLVSERLPSGRYRAAHLAPVTS
jgi:NAD(P)-dependent dehydrogenase (short-subunit alcohol dehydrogenase family)